MKIGDKVSFLSEVGGGRVAGFQGRDIVLVEDEDGFQIPVNVSDVVVMSTSTDYSAKMTSDIKQNAASIKDPLSNNMSVKARLNMADDEYDYIDSVDIADQEITFKPNVEERKGGNLLNCCMAFVPQDIKEISHSRFESFFVNDSNYFVRYACYVAEDDVWRLLYEGEAEPNTKIFLAEFGKEDLNDIRKLCWQLISYKLDKSFVLKPVINNQIRIDGVKFFKLHTFKNNDFFDTPALIYDIVKSDEVIQTVSVDPQQLKQQMFHKEDKEYKDEENTRKVCQSSKSSTDTEIIDLHANCLLETVSGMSSSDILNYQMDVFRNVLSKYQKNKGKKIIFIHGKGEGVLRHAIIHELNYKYKNYLYQDASFQEYGYGATQVIIR